jgi:hypothetical protein
VLSASIEVAKAAQRDHVVANVAPLTIGTTNVPSGLGVHDPIVYYMRFGDRIKIGTTTNLRSRLTSVPCDEVLAVEPGSYELERMRHDQFAESRITGEWFGQSEELLSHIASLHT